MKTLVYYLKRSSMNPQKTIKYIIVFLLFSAVTIACKKDEPVEIPTDSTPVQQLVQDDSQVEVDVDEVIIDAGQVLAGAGNLKSLDLPCNTTLESVYVTNDTVNYHLVYHGLNCAMTRHRTGSVIIKLKQNTQWTLPGAFYHVEFIDYEVTSVLNSNSVKINGKSSLENVSGGVIQQLGTGASTVIYKNTAHVSIEFNDNQSKDWNLTKLLVYTGSANNLKLAVNGFGSAHGYNSLLSWGKDREGRSFFSQVAQPIVYTEACNFLPSDGQQIYSIPADNLKATVYYGYKDNEPISAGECPTQYKLEWQQNGESGSFFVPLTGNMFTNR